MSEISYFEQYHYFIWFSLLSSNGTVLKCNSVAHNFRGSS